MKFLFIYPDIDLWRVDYLSKGGQYNPGLATLAACLKKAGHETKLLHICTPVEKESLYESIDRIQPDVIGFTATTLMFRHIKRWATWLRERDGSHVPLICGGVHCILKPEGAMGTGLFDAVSISEAEESLVELCDRMDRGKDYLDLRGFWFKRNGEVIRNGAAPLVEDLNTLPPQDTEIFDFDNFESSRNRNAPYALFLSSRGCPFRCTYCANGFVGDIYENPAKYATRRLTPANLVSQLKGILTRHPYIRYFNFLDSNIDLYKPWLREFVGLYKREIGLPFRARSTPNVVTEESIALLKEAGCFRMGYGVEAGNEEYRRTILNRPVLNKHLHRSVEWCQKYGIETYTFNMVGLPGETRATMLETVKLNAQLKVDIPLATVFYPFPDGPLYALAKEKGYLPSDDEMYDREVPNMAADTILVRNTVSRDEVLFFHRYFQYMWKLYRWAFAAFKPLDRFLEAALDAFFLKMRLPYRLLVQSHDRYFKQKYVSFLYRRSEIKMRTALEDRQPPKMPPNDSALGEVKMTAAMAGVNS